MRIVVIQFKMIENNGMDALTKNQLTTLKQSLKDLRGELTGMLSDSLESSRPVGLDQPIGRLSRMDALQQQSMTQASRRAAEMRISKIDSALHRIPKMNSVVVWNVKKRSDMRDYRQIRKRHFVSTVRA